MNDKFRFIGDLSIVNVGATIGRPYGFVKQNRIAARRLSIISFGNPNNCNAIVGRALSERPYSLYRKVFNKSEFERRGRYEACNDSRAGNHRQSGAWL